MHDLSVICHPNGTCQISRTECHGTWTIAQRDSVPWVARINGPERSFCKRRLLGDSRIWFEVVRVGLYEFRNFNSGDGCWHGFFYVHDNGSISLLTPAAARRRANAFSRRAQEQAMQEAVCA